MRASRGATARGRTYQSSGRGSVRGVLPDRYVVANKRSLWRGLCLSLAAALLQATVAVAHLAPQLHPNKRGIDRRLPHYMAEGEGIRTLDTITRVPHR